MNIFATNAQAKLAALEHCDRHIVKMILETAQMLSCAHWILDNKIVGYKPTHWNHPCSDWIRASSENYQWTYSLLVALCDEYKNRYLKPHKTATLLTVLKPLPKNIPAGRLTPWALAMDEEFKGPDQNEAYRKYLLSKFEEWTNRVKPLGVCWTNRTPPSWVSQSFGTKTVYRKDGRVTIRVTEKIHH